MCDRTQEVPLTAALEADLEVLRGNHHTKQVYKAVFWKLYEQGYKRCPCCDRLLTLDSYHSDSAHSTRLATKCKPCILEKNRDYASRNKEKLSAKRSREWASLTPEERQEARDRNRKDSTNYRKNHPERKRKAGREWGRRNRDKTNAQCALRRARMRDATAPDADLKAIEAIYAEARELSEAFGVQYHVDHVRAIARGGLHHESNLEIILAEDNLSKNAREDWTPPPPTFRKHTRHLACGLIAHYEWGEFKGITTNQ